MISLKYPGKLFIVGEYAIMEPNQSAVIAAMNRFMYVNIEKSDSLLVSSAFGTLTSLSSLDLDGPMRFVSAALKCVHEYIGHHDQAYKLSLRSELEDDSKKKYGLGSSGVVMVATIAAVLELYEIPYTKIDLFKLSVLAQRDLDELSSGGDIAAAVYSGVVGYTRYDYQWIQNKPIQELMSVDWPGLTIQPLHQNNIDFDVVWTQSENKTTPYLREFLKIKQMNKEHYLHLITRSNEIVKRFIEAWNSEDNAGVNNETYAYRKWMLEVQEDTGLNIETKDLHHIIEIAKNHKFVGKISGSGGGDCAIVMNVQENIENRVKMHKELQKHGILLLDIEVYYDKYSIETKR